MQQKKTNFKEIIEKTGIPRGSFDYWIKEADIKPLGPARIKPGYNFMECDYPIEAIEKIKKLYDISKKRREGKLM